MKKYEKEILQAFIDNENDVINQLKATFEQTLKDIDEKIDMFMSRNDSDMQYVIYQVEYQKALRKQISSVLDDLHTNEFVTISEYLTKCYDEGFVSSMYSLQQQGIPLCFPIDQEAVVNAVQLDSKISNGLYSKIGEDVTSLKKKIAAEVSRGISNGSSYHQIAQQIKNHMVGAYTKKTGGALYRAELIARTEGHRVQVQSAVDASYKAKAKGADVRKQWNATLDGRTRPSHAKVHNEVRELDEKFSNGLMYPGDPSGGAAEVCHCRCAYSQRARWGLGDGETQMLGDTSKMTKAQKESIATMLKVPVDELDEYSKCIVPISAKDYDDFKEQYKKIWNYKGSDLEKEVEARRASYYSDKKSSKVLEKTKKSGKITKALTDDEVKTVQDYMSAKSYTINGKLRTKTPLTDEEKEFVKNMNEALDKMPTYSGNLQRSLFFDDDASVQAFMADYTPGSPIKYKEFLSTTKGTELYNPEGQVQILIRDSKNGRDISSINDKEQEVLYKTDSEFVVVDTAEKGGKHYILLEEKQP